MSRLSNQPLTPFLVAAISAGLMFLATMWYLEKRPPQPEPTPPSPNIATPKQTAHTRHPGGPDTNLSLDWGGLQQYTNRHLFFTKGFQWIARQECGPCRKPCHDDENDRGGITCIGMAEHFNTHFYVRLMNNMFNKCTESLNEKGQYVLTCTDMRHPIQTLKERYYELYYKQFEMCPWEASMLLTDSAITSGGRVATRLLQKSSGLKADGIFGPKSLNACRHISPKAYLACETKRYQSLKQCPRYCGGWLKRVREKSEVFGK